MSGSTFVACPTWLYYCLYHENTSTPMFTCFASRACFVLLVKTRPFASTALFPTVVRAVNGESPNPFAMSARFHFEFWFTAAKSQVSCLSTMGFAFSQSWLRAIQNGKPAGAPKSMLHGANGAVTQKLTSENKSRLTKLYWLATRQSGGCQLLLQILPYLEGTAKFFCRTNRDISSAVIISPGKMMHYFR